MNRGDVPDTKAKPDRKGGQADQKVPANAGSAQHAPDEARDGMKPKAAESKPDKADRKAASGMNDDKAEDRLKADSKGTTDSKTGSTTGQAAAGARQLNAEQRTTMRTVIKEQNVRPVTNVNFSISVGTQVPRTVTFHRVPRQLVTVYPDWQGYEYFLVDEQIIIVNPRTLQIVAVLEA
jgi:hypothetical protein